MATIQELVAEAISKSIDEMNDYINTQGMIKPSSKIIKGWHNYDNEQWELILAGAKALADAGDISLPSYVERDIDVLLKHIAEYEAHCDNLMYPTPALTAQLPSAVTHADKRKYDKTIKTRTFRTMMNIREAICAAIDIDLPNDDSSKGKLDPKPGELLFE